MIGQLVVTKSGSFITHEYYCDRCPAPKGAVTLDRAPAGKPRKCATCFHKLGAMRPPVDQRTLTKAAPEESALLDDILAQVQVRATG